MMVLIFGLRALGSCWGWEVVGLVWKVLRVLASVPGLGSRCLGFRVNLDV